MPDLIDFDAGTVIRGEETVESCGHRLVDVVLDVASGRMVPKAVSLGQDDFIPWKRGVSL
jgi:altronate hydrolase